MTIKNEYIIRFNELLNSNKVNFDEYIASSIFRRRLLNYLDIIGCKYAHNILMKIFIRRDELKLDKIKTILSDLGVLKEKHLENDIVYSTRGVIPYRREELLNDIEDGFNLGKEKIAFNFNSYLKEINSRVSNNNINIRDGLMCEELISNMPVITTSLATCLKRMYAEGIYTNNSPKIIRLLSSSFSKEKTTYMELLIESYGRNFDLSFINRLIKLYDYRKHNEILDEIINRVVNSKQVYFTERLIPVIYDFYRRYNDLNALDKLVQHCEEIRISLKNIGIPKQSIGALLQFYTSIDIYNDRKDVIIFLLNDYGDMNLRKNN